MKRILIAMIALACSLAASAQVSKMPQRVEIIQIENEGDATFVELFNSPKDGQNHYFLSVGRLGIGGKVVQINIDPLSELFIPLGDTLEEAMESLKDLQALFKTSPGTSREISGCVAIGFPKEDLEPVTVTYRKELLNKLLEFSVTRGEYIRSAQVAKSDLGSLVTSLKLHRKLHPKQK